MNYFAVINLAGILFAFYLGNVVYLRDPSNKLNRIFFVNILLMVYTGFIEYFRLTASNIYWVSFWNKASFIWPFFPVIFLKFVLILSNHDLNRNKKFNIIIYSIPAVISFLHLFSTVLYSGFRKRWFGWEVIFSHNIYSVIIPVYFAAVSILTLILIIKFYIRNKDREARKRTVYIILGMSIPLIAAYISEGLFPLLGIRIPPIEGSSFILGAIFLAIGILKNKSFIADPIVTLKTMFASMTDFMFLFDQEGKILLASNSFLEYSDYSEKEIIGKNLQDFVDHKSTMKPLNISLMVGRELEFFLRTHVSTKIPISATTSLINSNHKNGIVYLFLARDLRERKNFERQLLTMQLQLEEKVKHRTNELANANSVLKLEIEERKKIEQALRDSEKKYRHVIENATEIIYVTNSTGKIAYVNDAALESSGYTLSEIWEKNYFDLIHPDYRNKIKRQLFKQYISKKLTSFTEFPIYSKSGKIIWWSQNNNLMIEKGKFIGFQIIARDITKRKNAEEALKKSEELYRNFVEDINEIYYTVDEDGIINYMSPNVKTFNGFDADEFIGKSYIRFISRKDILRVVEHYHKCVRDGIKDTTFEFLSLRKDGTSFWAEQITRLIRDSQGNVTEYRSVLRDINFRKSAERALKESEEKYRSLIENINEVYYIADKSGKTIYISSNVFNFTGYPAGYFIGKSSFILTYKEDFRKIFNFYQEKIKDGTIDATLEFRAVKKNGKPYWVEQITRIERDKNGNFIQFRSVVRDITSRKAAEEKLELLAQAVKSTGESISITDLSNKIIFVNDAFINLYGYSRGELIGKNISLVRAETNPDPLIDEIKLNTIKQGWNGELINKKKDGTEFPVFLSTSSVHNEKGEVFALVGVTKDITERRKAEKELEEYKDHLEYLVKERTQKLDNVNKKLEQQVEKLLVAEQNIQNQVSFLQTLIDTIPNPIFIRNTNKIYTDCNKAFEEFCGKPKTKIIGKNNFEINIKNSPETADEKDDELLSNPGKQKFEINVIDSKGIEHESIVYKATFKKSDGSIGGIVGIILDISEIKKLEKEIIKSLEKEKELSELKSRFISVASHEFRTPLTSILASADLLELYGRKWPESKYYEYTGNIQRAVEYMTDLINDVLTVSKTDGGNIKFNPESINFAELSKEILENVKLTAAEKVKFDYEYLLEKESYNLDKKLITQILTNLLSNAVKYSYEGGTVHLVISKEFNSIVIIVTDEGIGISNEDQKLLFEPFHRGENVGNISGTGLGLSIVKKSAEIHGGWIKVKSKINEGTKFTVVLNYVEQQQYLITI